MRAFFTTLFAASLVASHGFLEHPTPRGHGDKTLGEPRQHWTRCPKTALKEPTVVQRNITLHFNIKAGHPGECEAVLLNTHQRRIVSLGNKTNCVASAGKPTWSIALPDSVAPGKYILEWRFKANNLGKTEFYQNCADIRLATGKRAKPKSKA